MPPHRRTLVFRGLLLTVALVALSGCKTKIAPSPASAATETGSGYDGPAGSQRATRRSESKAETPAPTGDATPTPADPSAKPATTPRAEKSSAAAAPASAPVASTASPAAATPQAKSSPPATTGGTTPQATAAESARTGRVSLALPPVAAAAPRPVPRLTLASPTLPDPTIPNTPPSLRLASLGAGASTTNSAPRSPVVITAPAFSDGATERARPQTLDLFSRLAPSQETSSIQGRPLHAPASSGSAPIPVRFDQADTLPLPDVAPVLPPAGNGPAASPLDLPPWLSAPAPPPAAESPAARKDRETLHLKVYQILLGQP